ncbi:translation initiation factor IF-2-like [Schistocerca nitens]|uniref:translation initiation factor IF-2-like n=1 Tax=Schistocerca nitens TaxID=7011 RepID=UPI0021189304|nr:translation initiation factor IF-2-like [Schistocerca nitens]
MPDRCVKCAGAHAGRACPRPPTEKPTCALCGGAHVASYRGCEVWKRAIARQRGQTPAPRPKKPATRRPGVSFTATTSGAPSAVPAASAASAPAASEAVPTPEAPAPPPQLLVADPGTASPGTSAGPRPANRRRGGHRPVGDPSRRWQAQTECEEQKKYAEVQRSTLDEGRRCQGSLAHKTSRHHWGRGDGQLRRDGDADADQGGPPGQRHAAAAPPGSGGRHTAPSRASAAAAASELTKAAAGNGAEQHSSGQRDIVGVVRSRPARLSSAHLTSPQHSAPLSAKMLSSETLT